MTAPAMFRHALALYAAMDADASDTERGRVWEGPLTRFIRDLDIPEGYYSPIMRLLKATGSVEQIRRGGGHPPTPSKWLLIRQPELQDYDDARQATSPMSNRALSKAVRDINERLGQVEDVAERLVRNVFDVR